MILGEVNGNGSNTATASKGKEKRGIFIKCLHSHEVDAQLGKEIFKFLLPNKKK